MREITISVLGQYGSGDTPARAKMVLTGVRDDVTMEDVNTFVSTIQQYTLGAVARKSIVQVSNVSVGNPANGSNTDERILFGFADENGSLVKFTVPCWNKGGSAPDITENGLRVSPADGEIIRAALQTLRGGTLSFRWGKYVVLR